jgi:colanic acid biosynthesis glycosyl transferase WcaI
MIALVSHNYWPEPTGIPQVNTELARWLAAKGYEMEVWTGLPHYPWWRVPDAYQARDYRTGKGDEHDGAVLIRRVRHYVPQLPLSGAKRMLMDASYLWQWFCRSFAMRRRPQVLVLVAPPFAIGFLGLWLRLRFRCPVIYHVQDLQIDAAAQLGMISHRLSRLLLMAERIPLRRLDVVTACGQGMLRRIRAKGPLRRPPVHFPNWVDLAGMRPPPGANRYRQDWGLEPDAVVVAYSGNLGRKQGLDDLIEAIALLQDDARIRPIIAGQGAERPALERLVAAQAPWIRLLDLQPVERLSEFLAAADIHAVPQKRGAADLVLPSKLGNIMAVGRPVVAAAESGTELYAVVMTSGCGLCVPPEDPEAFAAAIRSLAADPARRAAMGAAGRAWAERHLGIDAVLGRFSRVLTALSHQRKS